MKTSLIAMEAKNHLLSFDPGNGRLVSFRSKAAPKQEFIAASEEHPVFVLQYLDAKHQYQQLTSLQAGEARVEIGSKNKTLTTHFSKIGGLDFDVTTTVKVSPDDPYSRWSISLKNSTGFEVVDLQFPFVVVRYDLGGKPGTRQLVSPQSGTGRLVLEPKPWTVGIAVDQPAAWRVGGHYPGDCFAQFMAYYNDRAGLYLACEDNQANVKLFKTLHSDPGLRMGLAHVGDWPTNGERRLEYEIVMTGFQGDWYAAADLYRDWSLQQPWATPLHKRKDVPEWSFDSPLHITVRPQGELDMGPIFPVKEFLPYEKTLPLLQKISKRVEAPLAVIIMGWERGGSWVYPDCFPPIGGDESITRFTKAARERGWHVGSFCNGTRWVIAHLWNGYDGAKFLDEHHGRLSLCQTPDGGFVREGWDASWRPSYRQCMGTKMTREIAVDFLKRLLGWGMESIQFFDQNCSAETFPCFARDHEHPPIPGKWMRQKMGELMQSFNKAAAQAGEPGVIQSVENPCNETCLPLFQQCDSRLIPPGHSGEESPPFIPLYHYLYHECILMHGMMSRGPEPYHLPISNAYNLVLGENVGAILTGDGTLLNKDSFNWAPWENPVGNNDDSLEMIRTAIALRRGPGKDFLVFGRMQHPAGTDPIKIISWESHRRWNEMPAVFHAAWQAPDGRLGVVLANWTTQRQTVKLVDKRLGKQIAVITSAKKLTRKSMTAKQGRLTVTLPPLSCMLVEPSSIK